jgi:hypothetical protein
MTSCRSAAVLLCSKKREIYEALLGLRRGALPDISAPSRRRDDAMTRAISLLCKPFQFVLQARLLWSLSILGVLFFPDPIGAEMPVPCEAEPTDMTLPFGALITCQIDVLGDTDVFRFQGTAGEVVAVQAAMPGVGESSLELFDPDGILVDSATGLTTARVRVTLPKTGSHAVVIKEASDDETDAYTLALERIAPPTPGAPRVLFGSATPEEMDAVGDLDLYKFEAASGEAVMAQAAMPGVGESQLELFDPDGLLVSSSSGLTSARVDAMLAKSGVYSLLVKESSDDETDAYTLVLERVSECRGTKDRELSSETVSATVIVEACSTISAGEGYTVAASADVTFLTDGSIVLRDGFTVQAGGRFTADASAWGTPIEYGADLRPALTLVGDTELFRFAGEAGETIVTQAVMPGSAESRIEVYDPDGFLLAASDGLTTGRVDLTLTASGSHSILVKESSDDETEVFTLVLERVSPPSIAARALCFGCDLADTIEPVGDLDLFKFVAMGTETISAQASMPGVGEARLELYDPDGVLIASNDGLTTASIQTGLTKSGTHVLVVKEASDDETDVYNITLQCVGGCTP